MKRISLAVTHSKTRTVYPHLGSTFIHVCGPDCDFYRARPHLFSFRFVYVPLVALFVSLSSQAQTTVVMVRDGDQVVIAADSKVSTQTEPFCKIRPCGDSFLTVSGLYTGRIGAKKQLFESWPNLLKSCSAGITPVEQIYRLERASIQWLDTIFTYSLQNSNQEAYKKVRSRSLQIGIAGWRNTPYILTRIIADVTPESSTAKAGVIQKEDFDGVLPANVVAHRILGHFENLPPLAERGLLFGRLGLTKGAEFFVNQMIVARPMDVGPPIDILRVTKNGAEWIKKKPQCPEINTGFEQPAPNSSPTTATSRPARIDGHWYNNKPLVMIASAVVLVFVWLAFRKFR